MPIRTGNDRPRGRVLPALRGLLVLCLMLSAGATAARAQSGKLSGVITDETGGTLPGAAALLEGTQFGAAADAEGQYVVLNIPPGTYRVRVSMVGFQTKVVDNVLVTSNQTTTLNVTLAEETIQGEEVIVTAERPLVDVSLTSAMSTLSRQDIEALPVQSLEDIVNLQAGVVDGHFRGGRQGEVQYQVDGVSVNNPFNNQSTLRLDRSVLQEVQVIQGTFDAEYGQAMSGVVNAVLRAGDPNRYDFNFETYLGDYYSVRSSRFPEIGTLDPLVRQNYQASLSGPVPVVPKTTFLLSGQRLTDEGYFYGRRYFLPTDSSNFEQGNFLDAASGDSALVPLGFSNQWSFLGKLSNTSIPNVKLEYQAVGNVLDWKGYNHGFRINPEGTTTQHQFSIVHGLDVTHTLSPRTYYELNLRQNYIDYHNYKYEDVYDPRYFVAGEPRGDINFFDGASVQGLDLTRFIQKTNALVVKGAVTSQVTDVHLLKFGGEFQASALDFGAPGILGFRTVDGVLRLQAITDTLDARVLSYNPVQAALFAQDRIEWGDLRIRAGLRLEYFDANSDVPSDLANPANAIPGAPQSTPKSTTVKMALAPRLGVSFPILETASVFFSYGHFYQLPGLGQFFSNSDYSVLRDLQQGGISYGVLGNPDLDPEFTTQYEFGFKSEIGPFLGLDLSLFYKDIRDLLGVEFVQTYAAAEYARLTNVDFGGVRGFTLALDQRGPGALSTSVDYTLQLATGNTSDPRETANRAAAGEDPRPRQIPFAWDQRHSLNASVVWSQPGNYIVTGILRLASGQPYTPTLSTVFGSDLEPNSGRKPGYATVDLRAEKFFQFGGMSWTAFARVFNLFDQHFTNGFVFPDTGSPYYTLTPEAQRATLSDPSRFSAPRRFELGVSVRGMLGTR